MASSACARPARRRPRLDAELLLGDVGRRSIGPAIIAYPEAPVGDGAAGRLRGGPRRGGRPASRSPTSAASRSSTASPSRRTPGRSSRGPRPSGSSSWPRPRSCAGCSAPRGRPARRRSGSSTSGRAAAPIAVALARRAAPPADARRGRRSSRPTSRPDALGLARENAVATPSRDRIDVRAWPTCCPAATAQPFDVVAREPAVRPRPTRSPGLPVARLVRAGARARRWPRRPRRRSGGCSTGCRRRSRPTASRCSRSAPTRAGVRALAAERLPAGRARSSGPRRAAAGRDPARAPARRAGRRCRARPPDGPDGRAEAVRVARGRRGIVALPTDTVYGIAVALATPGGIERLFAAKQRPPDKAIALLLADAAQARRDRRAGRRPRRALAARVLAGRPDARRRRSARTSRLPDGAHRRRAPTIGLRVPDHDAPRALARAARAAADDLGQPSRASRRRATRTRSTAQLGDASTSSSTAARPAAARRRPSSTARSTVPRILRDGRDPGRRVADRRRRPRRARRGPGRAGVGR